MTNQQVTWKVCIAFTIYDWIIGDCLVTDHVLLCSWCYKIHLLFYDLLHYANILVHEFNAGIDIDAFLEKSAQYLSPSMIIENCLRSQKWDSCSKMVHTPYQILLSFLLVERSIHFILTTVSNLHSLVQIRSLYGPSRITGNSWLWKRRGILTSVYPNPL